MWHRYDAWQKQLMLQQVNYQQAAAMQAQAYPYATPVKPAATWGGGYGASAASYNWPPTLGTSMPLTTAQPRPPVSLSARQPMPPPGAAQPGGRGKVMQRKGM